MNTTETKARLERIFQKLFAHNRYAAGREDYFDIEIQNLSDDLAVFDLVVSFKSGERYCCMEPVCHFGLWQRKEWQAIRNEMLASGLGALSPLTIRKFRVQIQQGALFGLKFPGDDRELEPHDAFVYELGPFREASPESIREG